MAFKPKSTFMLEPGMVLLVSECYSNPFFEDGDPNELLKPTWAIVTRGAIVRQGAWVRWLDDVEREVDVVGCSDCFEIVPPEEWPDEVVTAVAKHVLLGEPNNEA